VADVVAYVVEPVALRPSASARAIPGIAGCVTGNYFSTLGGLMRLGRPLSALDDRAETPPVAVLSDAFWTRELARSPDVVGRALVVGGLHVTIVGVARPEFIGLYPILPDFWLTLAHA